jgi:hypothetical protein
MVPCGDLEPVLLELLEPSKDVHPIRPPSFQCHLRDTAATQHD